MKVTGIHSPAAARKIEHQKRRSTERIVVDVARVLSCGEESISVAIEEVEPEEWAEKVYRPEILDDSAKLEKKPGYTM